MKVKIAIEEVISQEFEVEVSSLENAYEEIREKYMAGLIELNPGEVQSASLLIKDDDSSDSDWLDLHV